MSITFREIPIIGSHLRAYVGIELAFCDFDYKFHSLEPWRRIKDGLAVGP